MIFPYVIALLIGLGFGSFASVVIHRLHSKEGGIFWGRSKCPRCQHTLNAIDLIPVFGFIINKFKCRYCSKRISYRYPVLELTMGSAFAITTFMIGLGNPLLLAYFLLLTFVFVTISFYDIFFQEIPDELSIPTILLSGIVGYFAHLHSLSSLGIGFTIPVLFFGILFFGSQGRWLGGGDLRVGAIMGFVLGWPNILVGMFLGYLLGSIYSAFGLISGKLSRKSPIPFGPFLFGGTYIAIFWGNHIVNWYLGLM
ncbi:prepilin peptidase [Candidatus Pacearchaeota archaeon]|nr:prepilin peptidase [Candidatus Pacearchaeota archaeon]